jgi:hypothetical protein
MAQQELNASEIGAGFEQMGGEGMPQGVRVNWFRGSFLSRRGNGMRWMAIFWFRVWV